MEGTYWIVEAHAALTAGLRSQLTSRYGWVNQPSHTHVALIAIRTQSIDRGSEHVATFPYSFVAADWMTNASGLEAAIDTECRSRLATQRNADGLPAIAGRRHWL